MAEHMHFNHGTKVAVTGESSAVIRPRTQALIVANMGISSHRKIPTLLRRLGSTGLLLRFLIVLLFVASFGFRLAEPCWGGHHHAEEETAGAHQQENNNGPEGHHHSEHESADGCCASASACDTRGNASLTSAASTVRDSIQIIPVLISGLPLLSPALHDNASFPRRRDHAPPSTPLFITLKALLI